MTKKWVNANDLNCGKPDKPYKIDVKQSVDIIHKHEDWFKKLLSEKATEKTAENIEHSFYAIQHKIMELDLKTDDMIALCFLNRLIHKQTKKYPKPAEVRFTGQRNDPPWGKRYGT